jgi:hypothetical protein
MRFGNANVSFSNENAGVRTVSSRPSDDPPFGCGALAQAAAVTTTRLTRATRREIPMKFNALP